MQKQGQENIKFKVMPQDLKEAKQGKRGKVPPFHSLEFNISQGEQERLKEGKKAMRIEPQKMLESQTEKKKEKNNTLWMILGILTIIFFIIGGISYYFRFYREKGEPAPQPLARDSDNDGLSDAEERELGTNPESIDTDGDGMSDGWEVQYQFNPLDIKDKTLDADEDGLLNIDEFNYQTDPLNADTDGDGYADGVEVENHYSPLAGPGVRLEGFEEGGGREEEKEERQDGGRDEEAKKRDERRRNDLKILELALEIYLEDHPQAGYPESLDALVPEYLSELPRDPLSPQYEYEYIRENEEQYVLKIYLEEVKDYYVKKVSASKR